jgi:proline racemase
LGTSGTLRTIRTIDAHAAGAALRLIVDGFPSPRGRTMVEKRVWLTRYADHLRRALVFEPRGHADMCAAILTEAVSPASHAGVVFMDHSGYGAMSGHGIIAVVTVALQRGLIVQGDDSGSVILDTVAGTIRARANPTVERRVGSVSFLDVPSFVLHGGVVVTIGNRRVRADVAYGGVFYAIVDGEAVGLPIDGAHVAELRRTGMAIAQAVENAHPVAHPADAALGGIAGTIFTGPPRDARAALRNVTVFADGRVDRSPSGTGTAAVMAVLDAMGMLGSDVPFVQESLIGTFVTGRIAGRTTVGDYSAIVPEIEGSAWITGEHTFVIDEADPLKSGFRV